VTRNFFGQKCLFGKVPFWAIFGQNWALFSQNVWSHCLCFLLNLPADLRRGRILYEALELEAASGLGNPSLDEEDADRNVVLQTLKGRPAGRNLEQARPSYDRRSVGRIYRLSPQLGPN
jgi:hypothetical protein